VPAGRSVRDHPTDRLEQAEGLLAGLDTTLTQADIALAAFESASVSFEELIDGVSP
jgi:hypothetical protein